MLPERFPTQRKWSRGPLRVLDVMVYVEVDGHILSVHVVGDRKGPFVWPTEANRLFAQAVTKAVERVQL